MTELCKGYSSENVLEENPGSFVPLLPTMRSMKMTMLTILMPDAKTLTWIKSDVKRNIVRQEPSQSQGEVGLGFAPKHLE